MTPLKALFEIYAFAHRQQALMNGTPPTYDDSRPPTGDDWNDLFQVVLGICNEVSHDN